MPLNRFIDPLDVRAVAHHAGAVLYVLAGSLAVPALAAIAFREPAEALLTAGTAALSLVSGRLLRRGPPPPLRLREAMALAALAYLLFAVGGAVAFLGVAGPVDAFFESMSGFTTTGLSVTDPEALPRSLVLLRALSQWIGGAGIILLSIVVLSGPGSAAARLYAAELGRENMLGSVGATARALGLAYAGLTAVAYVALLAAGAGLYDGLAHALALVSTGGFSPFSASIGAYSSSPIAVVTAVFMVLGAVSFPLYYLAWRGSWRRVYADAQVRLLAVLLALAGALFVAFEGTSDAGGAIFHAVSALTTTGFSLGDPAEWSGATRLLGIGLMLSGGSVGSTAGGLKLLRLLILVRVAGWSVTRVFLPPSAKVPLKIQGAVVEEAEVRQAFALTTSYGALLFVSALALAGAGVAIDDALFDTASALGTVGLSVGVVSADLADWAKLLLAFNMWAGRLELLALLVLLHPHNWHR